MIGIELIIATSIGILVGVITGLTPGIHINMAALFAFAISPILIYTYHVSPISIGVCIIALGVTHTFLDSIPSIYLGAPDENTILGVLPGHRYLLRGNGLMAVKLFTIGSLLGMIVGILMIPAFIIITKYAYDWFKPFFAIILIATTLFMIWRDEKKLWAISVVMLSGLLGMILFTLPVRDPLFPLLSGLFGIATLLISLNDKNTIPKQHEDTCIKLDKKKTALSIIAGNISGFIVSTFPGLSGSIAAMLSMQLVRDLKDHGFMILMGVIGTSSFVLSLVALYTIDKARNGAVIVISKLVETNTTILLIFVSVALMSAGIAAILAMRIGRLFGQFISRINYQYLVIGIIVFVTLMVIIFSSWMGLIILIIATAIGLIPGIVKVQRTHAMACLIIPIITYLI